MICNINCIKKYISRRYLSIIHTSNETRAKHGSDKFKCYVKIIYLFKILKSLRQKNNLKKCDGKYFYYLC